jgi:acyl dehydratase
MNHHPVHLNTEYALHTQHKKILVVGTLVFSIVVGMTVQDISGKAVANLEYEEIKHLAPVYLNDTLYAMTKILDKKPSRTKNDRGIVHVETIARNQNGIDVLSFRRKVLVLKNEGV